MAKEPKSNGVSHPACVSPIRWPPCGRGIPQPFASTARPTDQPYVEADIRPVRRPGRRPSRLIAFVRNITPEVVQQQKLDALHPAGRELAGLDPEQLAEMNVAVAGSNCSSRTSAGYIHDLLHYDTIEVRLLDRQDRRTEAAARRRHDCRRRPAASCSPGRPATA